MKKLLLFSILAIISQAIFSATVNVEYYDSHSKTTQKFQLETSCDDDDAGSFIEEIAEKIRRVEETIKVSIRNPKRMHGRTVISQGDGLFEVDETQTCEEQGIVQDANIYVTNRYSN